MNLPLIKVMCIVPNLSGGGAERVVVTLLRHFDRSRIEPILLALDLKGPYVKDIPTDIHVNHLHVKRVRHAWLKMIREINRINPDVIFSTMDYMNFAVLAARRFYRKGTKLIIREANTARSALAALPPLKRWLFKTLYQLLYPKADMIITQSVGMYDDLLNFLPALAEQQVKQIYNPLDLGAVTRQALMLPCTWSRPGGKQIVAAGRLTYQKGFDLLLHALRQVINHRQDVQLTILGEGPLRNELESLAVSLDLAQHVTFAGFQENPHRYMLHADLFVLSSRWEGFPNIVLEALACGCPVVATDCPSGPREILQDNRYGYLVESQNVPALAEGMCRMLNGEIKFAAGEERASCYDAGRITQEYEETFHQVLTKGRRKLT
ncbi:glycosyltransferase [Brevibacillus ginsengisoli]|uniref:glycosyltransferase n=1 Tax=Brevibacillus ginsengisoli TaxID=363854 RepID=UPI003CF634CC